MVRITLDEALQYRMSPEEKARLDAMTDDDIDYSDCPDMGGITGWTRSGRHPAVETRLSTGKAHDAKSTQTI